MSDYPSSDSVGQLPLFENPQATKPGESLQASEQNRNEAFRVSKPMHAQQRDKVLYCIRNAGQDGLTRKELAARLGIALSAACGRVNELLNAVDPDTGKKSPQVYQVKGVRRDGGMVVFAKGYV